MRLRARSEDGFGLIELLMAMVMLNVGLLALIAAFQSSTFALKRAAKISTAAAVADIQMERYRALRYDAIYLDSTSLTTAQADADYTGDAAYSATQVVATCGDPAPDQCRPIRSLTGPDGRPYRVDTYIVEQSESGGRTLKKITIVVRDGGALSGRALARVISTFDESTGL